MNGECRTCREEREECACTTTITPRYFGGTHVGYNIETQESA